MEYLKRFGWRPSQQELSELPASEVVNTYLYECINNVPPSDMSLENFIDYSDQFPIKFPIQVNRVKSLLNEGSYSNDVLLRNINETYPVVHERVIPLLCQFLDYKKRFGSKVEMELYKEMKLVDFVDRFFTKRAVCFVGRPDYYKLITGEDGIGWYNVGTDSEQDPLVLKNCLSYDEIKLSALFVVSSPSIFINNGSRNNMGVSSPRGTFEDRGVIVGVVGTRLVRPDVMEYEEVGISSLHSKPENGYGNGISNKHKYRGIWASFYNEEHLPTFNEAKSNKKFIQISKHTLFNKEIYKSRIRITADTLLLEAQRRAVESNTTAYVHIVGFGLGVWLLYPEQDKYFLEAFAESLTQLTLTNISDINFSWFRESKCKDVTNGQLFPGTGIQILFSKRNPHDIFESGDKGKLLVTCYAWDGNSLPGNEYWDGSLSSSGDPAAACASQVGELQNSYINSKIPAKHFNAEQPENSNTLVFDSFVPVIEMAILESTSTCISSDTCKEPDAIMPDDDPQTPVTLTGSKNQEHIRKRMKPYKLSPYAMRVSPGFY